MHTYADTHTDALGRTPARERRRRYDSSGRFEPRDGFARAVRGRATRRAERYAAYVSCTPRRARVSRGDDTTLFCLPTNSRSSLRGENCARTTDRASERGNVAHLAGRDRSRNVTQQSRSGDVAHSSGPRRRRIIPRASINYCCFVVFFFYYRTALRSSIPLSLMITISETRVTRSGQLDVRSIEKCSGKTLSTSPHHVQIRQHALVYVVRFCILFNRSSFKRFFSIICFAM